MLIAADGTLTAKELQWFRHLLAKYDFSAEQLKTLDVDLEGHSPLEKVFLLVRRAEDRKRLLEWARFASRIDGSVHYKEKDFLGRLEKLYAVSATAPQDEHMQMAHGVLEADRETQFWIDLRALGKFYSQSARGVRFGLWSRVHRSPNNRMIIWSLVVFVTLYFLIRIGIKLFYRGG